MTHKDKERKNLFTGIFGNDYCSAADSVTASEWSMMHPTNLKCRSDQYYADLANDLCDIIHKIKLPPSAPKNLAHELGIVLSAYLEDLVSGTKVFSALRSVCKNSYGYRLPFYDCNHSDYMPDHINLEDIKFLIWATACQLGKEKGIVYSPLATGWEIIADRIFDELNSRYEEAPEASRLTDWLHSGFRKSDYREIREIATWVVLLNPLSCIRGFLDEIHDEIRQIALNENPDYYNMEMITYGMIASSVWQRSMSVMGYESKTLVAALATEFGFDSLATDIDNIEALHMQIYALSNDKKSGKVIFETSSHKKQGKEAGQKIVQDYLAYWIGFYRQLPPYGNLSKLSFNNHLE